MSTPGNGGFPPQPQTTSAGMDDNISSLLCYLPFLLGVIASIVFLVVEPYKTNRLIRFHAFQSIFLAVALFVVGFTVSIISIVLGMIPGIGFVFGMLSILFSLVMWMGSLALYGYLMYKAYNNQRVVLPVIGAQAEKQA